jgi:hypothetical protein
MAKFVEMDENVTLKGQMENQVTGPVILINKFNVETSEEQRFLRAWQEDAKVQESTRIHIRPIT